LIQKNQKSIADLRLSEEMLSKSELKFKKVKKGVVKKGEKEIIEQLQNENATLVEQIKMLKEMLKSS